MEHSFFPPSSMDILVKCHGMPTMVADLPPEEDSEESREGTAAHWVCEKFLKEDFVTVGESAPNGVIVTDEMLDGAAVYVDKITSVGFAPDIKIESRVFIPQIHSECWGTPDAWWFNKFTWTLHVWDYKFGHRRVSAIELLQTITYAQGVLNEMFPLGVPQNVTIKICVVQPRCFDGEGPFSEWTTTAEDLRPYINQMEYAVTQSMIPGSLCSSGDHCRDCRARHRCDANLTSVAGVVDYSKSAIPRDLTPIALDYEGRVLDEALDRINARKKAIDAEIEARLRNGERIPGRALEPHKGHRAWLVDDDTLFSVGDMFGVDLRNTVPVTPAKADGLIKKAHLDPNVIADYYGKKDLGMKVVLDDGSRARRIFGKGEI